MLEELLHGIRKLIQQNFSIEDIQLLEEIEVEQREGREKTLIEVNELGELLGVDVFIKPTIMGRLKDGDYVWAVTKTYSSGETCIYVYLAPVILGPDAFNRVIAHEFAHVLCLEDEEDHDSQEFSSLVNELEGKKLTNTSFNNMGAEEIKELVHGWLKRLPAEESKI